MSLFCKPPAINNEWLYRNFDNKLSGSIRFRGIIPDTDIDFLHKWVNLPYATKFWQMDGSFSNLYSIYQDIISNPAAHSFIGFYDEAPVCQIDLYNISADELKDHIDFNLNDCGLHLLMQPPTQMIKGISHCMLSHFIRFYFSHNEAGTLYAEPDKGNVLANRLAVSVGFDFKKIIEMSYKTANLYSITKTQFHAKNINI